MSTLHEFFFENMAVGYFTGDEPPRLEGRYTYEPYRGSGHYEMQRTLDSGVCPRCYYKADPGRIWFTVAPCPEYGFLELRGFESSTAQS